MTEDMHRFDSLATALIWIAGVRALSGMPRPGELRDIEWRLIEDGWAAMLHSPTPFGGVSCIAMLPERLTEEQARRGDWFGGWREAEALRDMEAQGNA
jgi:hypothetical protein